jgi:hypothetical protein
MVVGAFFGPGFMSSSKTFASSIYRKNKNRFQGKQSRGGFVAVTHWNKVSVMPKDAKKQLLEGERRLTESAFDVPAHLHVKKHLPLLAKALSE